MTTTAQTESRYRATAERLISKCLTEFRMAEPDLTDQILADWMISHRTDWSAATWRQYRSALTFHLGPHMVALLGIAELPPAAPRGQKTSGLKEKKLPPDDLLKLFNHLIAKVTENPLCLVPECDGAFLTRQGEDALWQDYFTAAPARLRVFEPNSKRRKRAPGPLPSNMV